MNDHKLQTLIERQMRQVSDVVVLGPRRIGETNFANAIAALHPGVTCN